MSWFFRHAGKTYWVLAAITVLALLSFMSALLLGDANERSDLRRDLAKASLSLAVAASAGVLVKYELDKGHERRKDQSRQRLFKRHMIADLKAVHDGMEIACLLLTAHRTAKTYGEEMRRIIRLRVRVKAVKRAVEDGHVEFGEPRVVDAIKQALTTILLYLRELGTEYEREYLEVSRLQKVDEKIMNKRVEAMVVDGKIRGDQWQATAWDRIADKHKFPVLWDMIDSYRILDKSPDVRLRSVFAAYFKDPLYELSREIRAQVAGRKDRVPSWAAPDCDENLRAKIRAEIEGLADSPKT